MIVQLPNNYVVYTQQGPTTVAKLTNDHTIYDRGGMLVGFESITDAKSADVYKLTYDNGKTEVIGGDCQLDVFVNNQGAITYTVSELAACFVENAFVESQHACSYQRDDDNAFDPKTAAIHGRTLSKDVVDGKEIDELYRSYSIRQHFISGLMNNPLYYHENTLHFALTQTLLRDTISQVIESVGLVPVLHQYDDESTITISWQPRLMIKSIEKLSRKQKCRTITFSDSAVE